MAIYSLDDRQSLPDQPKMFAETLGERARRTTLGLAYALMPQRLRGVPPLVAFTLAKLVSGDRRLPDAAAALERPDGLAGLVGDLDVATMLEGYARGLYPFCHVGPLKWWAPRERMVLHFPEFHMAKRLRRQIRNDGYRVTFDRDFETVIRACAEPRPGRPSLTWITPKIMRAYSAAFEAGHVHSFEVWRDEALVGGGYGLAFGRLFSTESQFSRQPNTSKIGFAVLHWHLARWGFLFNDGKGFNPTIDGMGFRPMARTDFTAACAAHGRSHVKPGRWAVETDLATISKWDPKTVA